MVEGRGAGPEVQGLIAGGPRDSFDEAGRGAIGYPSAILVGSSLVQAMSGRERYIGRR